MTTLEQTLKDVERVAATGALPVLVFDLDSTLFNTAGRHLAILRAFADEHRELLPIAESLRVEDFGWHVDAPLRRHGVGEPLLEKLRAFWFKRFFHDDWLHHDHPAPGGPGYVQEVYRRGALVYYLTGRDVGGMARGTAAALIQCGYPFFSGRTILHLKPKFDMPDAAFKDAAMQDIRSHRGQVIATFENEPGNANLFLSSFPQATHFLVGNVCSPESPDGDPSLVRIPDFEMNR